MSDMTIFNEWHSYQQTCIAACRHHLASLAYHPRFEDEPKALGPGKPKLYHTRSPEFSTGVWSYGQY